jgi:hypothetical protein
MQPALTRIFISSTVYDLKDLRNTVQNALRHFGYAVLASEDGSIPVDSSQHSYDICLKAARDSECLIAIIDGRFGGTMPDGKTSITQAEIEAALGIGKQVLVFVRQAVWDAKEVYNVFRKTGQPFVPSTIVHDERVFGLIDVVRKRARANWIFQFNLPDDLIETILTQLGTIDDSSDAQVLGYLLIEEDATDDPPERFEVKGFPESQHAALRLAVRKYCGSKLLDSHIVWFEGLDGKRKFLFCWKEINEGLVDPANY